MADGIVTFFLQKLSDLLLQEASRLHGAEGELKQLQNELESMQNFIQDVDAERRYDKRFKPLVNQIRDVTFSAEDVVDEFVLKLNLLRRYKQKFLFIRWLKRCSRFPGTLRMLHNLNEQIRVINVRIEKIVSIKSRYNFDGLSSNEAFRSNSTEDVTPWKKGLSDIEEVDMVGILDGFVAVKKMLLDKETQRREVVAIVGMGGLGKTTLARRLYNSNEVKHCFKCRSWISISQKYNIRELLLRIAKDVVSFTDAEKKELAKIKEVDELGAKVRDCLKERHYFIVMDDIWDSMAWEILNSYLPDSENGSRILLTSRKKDVALYANPHTNPYELRHLSDHEGWDLLVRKIFRENTVSFKDSNVEKLGKEILKICGGLPLAIVVLGGLLSRKEMTVESWQKVLDGAKWHLDEGSSNSCMRILALSYNDLPYYLKFCFLYCGIFPEDYEIRADKLMRMWIVEGFVQKRANEKLEDVAEDYLEELIHRSMIQGGRKRSNGNLKSCRIHDLLRDLAISEAKETKCFEVFENTSELMITSATSIRRLIIPANPTNCSTDQISHCSHLRSLVCFSSRDRMEYHHCWRSLFASATLLRVLHFEEVYSIRALPNEIGDLIHMRYLCMRGCILLHRIPKSIGKLVNLQTLDLRDTNIDLMPYTIWKLRQLKHLYCPGIELSISRQSWGRKQVDGVPGVYQLTNLQTLHAKAGAWLEGNGLAKAVQLKELVLWDISCAYTKEITDSLSELTGLQILKWRYFSGKVQLMPQLSNHSRLYKLCLFMRLRELPSTTAFYPPNLMELRLVRSELEEDSMLMLEKLPKLRILDLRGKAYVGRKMVCASEGFPQLHSLQLQGLSHLEEWEVQELAMPVLRKLAIDSCEKLEMFPLGLLHLTTSLQEIKLWDASPKLVDEVKHMQHARRGLGQNPCNVEIK